MGLLLGLNGTSEKEVNLILRNYMQWTRTGSCDLDLFNENTALTYLGTEEIKSVLFQDYKAKIENAARSIPRNMSIKSVHITNEVAKAEITDHSEDHLFSFVHHVTLSRINEVWKISAIRFESN